MKNDEIDAVELVRQIRDEHHQAVQDQDPEQRRAFYRERATKVHERLGLPTGEQKKTGVG